MYIKRYIINDQIKANEVRLIDSEGAQLGIVSIQEARRLSSEQNLDLLLLSPKVKPPVCKIVNYGQFMYQQKKKDKSAKKNVQIIKEIKMSHKISIHDYNVRKRHAIKFLSKKFKVKVTLTFRGREIVHRDGLGVKLINKFIDEIKEYGVQDNHLSRSGRFLSTLINPK